MNFTSKSELMNWIDRYIDLVAHNLTCTEPSEYQLEITKKAYDQLKERVISLENKARGPSDEEILIRSEVIQSRRAKRKQIEQQYEQQYDDRIVPQDFLWFRPNRSD